MNRVFGLFLVPPWGLELYIYGDRDLFWFVQARPRPYFFGAGIVGAYFLLAQQNFGTEFSTLEKIWSRSIFDIRTRPRAPWRPTLGEGEAPADLLAGHFLAGFFFAKKKPARKFFWRGKICGRSLPEGGCPFLGDSPGMAFFRGVRLLI